MSLKIAREVELVVSMRSNLRSFVYDRCIVRHCRFRSLTSCCSGNKGIPNDRNGISKNRNLIFVCVFVVAGILFVVVGSCFCCRSRLCLNIAREGELVVIMQSNLRSLVYDRCVVSCVGFQSLTSCCCFATGIPNNR
jgi:hypothetical protein